MSAKELAITCRNLVKTYNVYKGHSRGYVLSKLFAKKKHLYLDQVHALKDISFDIYRGEVFGIVGHNGSGKSTLLACLSGITNHDSGSIDINGRIEALLQLGVGFHPRFTGRENVIIGLIAMGVPVKQALSSVDEIVEFAELQDFVDMPFYTYSSGMRARLQFSVAVHRSPEILLIDEALSTGDGYFVNKSQRRIEDICAGGSTVILVTHSISMVESLCDRVMILDHGKVVDIGSAVEMGKIYRRMLVEMETTGSKQLVTGADAQDLGTGEVQIKAVRVVDTDNNCPIDGAVAWNKPMSIEIDIVTLEPIENPRFVVQVSTARENALISQFGNSYVDPKTQKLEYMQLGKIEGDATLSLQFPTCPFGGNQYIVSFGMMPETRRRSLETYSDYYVFRRIATYLRVISFPENPSSVARTTVVEPFVSPAIHKF